jgi:excisionase family DNA binding protein
MEDRNMLDLLTLKEAAKDLRVSYSKAQELARAGELPVIKVGGRWRVSRQQLEAMFPVEKKEEKDNA